MYLDYSICTSPTRFFFSFMSAVLLYAGHGKRHPKAIFYRSGVKSYAWIRGHRSEDGFTPPRYQHHKHEPPHHRRSREQILHYPQILPPSSPHIHFSPTPTHSQLLNINRRRPNKPPTNIPHLNPGMANPTDRTRTHGSLPTRPAHEHRLGPDQWLFSESGKGVFR